MHCCCASTFQRCSYYEYLAVHPTHLASLLTRIRRCPAANADCYIIMLGLSGIGNWAIFIAYMVFGVSHSILVTWTQNEEKGYGYNATAAILHTEALKLIVAFILALQRKSIPALIQEISKNFKVFALYFVPALLYAIYNNLTFLSLIHFDPTTYYILLQLKVVFSGVVYQVIFQKRLSTKQWLSLVFLTIGCMLKQANPNRLAQELAPQGDDQDFFSLIKSFQVFFINPSILYLLLQVLCSTIAGVYTEFLIKEHKKDLDIWVQNIFMYTDSIVSGLVIFSVSGQPFDKLFCLIEEGVPIGHTLKIAAVICNMAAMGVTTALFLKSLNSIVKNFATALEVVVTAVVSWLIFGIPVGLLTAVAMAIIIFSIYIYSNNPLVQDQVVQAARKAKLSTSTDRDYELRKNGALQ